MAIVGTFLADFSQFSGAVDGAVAKLKAFEGQADASGVALDHAFAEMDADRHFVRLNDAAGVTTNTMGLFATSLGKVDRTLAQFGINITPMVAALREMAVVSGSTIAQLGLLGTSVASVAAGFGGWAFGRWIAGLTGSDQAIGDLTAKLLGMGNAADEIAAHKLEVLARASKVAGVEVSIFSEAVRILADESKRLAESLTTPEANMARMRGEVAAAQREYRGLSEEQRINIERMLEWGKSEAEIETQLKLTAGTVDVYIGRMKLKADQDKQNTKAADEHAAAIERITSAQKRFIELAPLQPKDVNITPESFQPTGAFASHLAEQTGIREQIEAQALLEQQMTENFLIIGQTTEAHKAAGTAAAESTGQAIIGYDGLTDAAFRAAAAIKLIVPQGFSMTQAYRDAGLFVHDSSFIGKGAEGIHGKRSEIAGPQVNVIVNAQGGHFQTPEDRRRLAQETGDALKSQLMSQGRQVA